MSQIEKELSQLIAEKLPKLSAEQLQIRLKQADELEEKVSNLESLIDSKIKHIDELNRIIEGGNKAMSELSSKLKEQQDFLNEKEAFRIKKIEFRALKAEIERDEAIKRSNDLKEISLGLVRNTEFKRTVFNNTNVTEFHTPEWNSVTNRNEYRKIGEGRSENGAITETQE